MFIFVSYYWGENKNVPLNPTFTYGKLAKRWISCMMKHKVKYHIEYRKEMENWKYQEAINYKPKFIEKCLEKFKMPVIYLDIDMELKKYPKLFVREKEYDFMAFNQNFDPRMNLKIDPFLLFSGGGMMYFNNTKQSLQLLTSWKKEIKQNIGKSEDRLLNLAFYKSDALLKCRVFWLPIEYFYIPSEFEQHGIKVEKQDIVICHNSELTEEPTESRISANAKKLEAHQKDYTLNYFKDSNPHYHKLQLVLIKRGKILKTKPDIHENDHQYDIIAPNKSKHKYKLLLHNKDVVRVNNELVNHMWKSKTNKELCHIFNSNAYFPMTLRCKF
tara:strand:+ start:112 stop:1098 length:987 start_codon:yes stop_codon:yes gene_type:complete